jgi:2-polyprenyl-3-methyl-5-hydroxy-6-metoxy-1,4-benzoquinol methylase
LNVEVSLDDCPVCASSAELWRTVNEYPIERCDSCGFAFVNPRPGRGAIAEMYRREGGHCQSRVSPDDAIEEERRAPNSTRDARRIIGHLVGALGGRGLLLDVGCGYGFFSKEAKRMGFVVESIEIAPVERDIASAMLNQEPLDLEFEDFPERSRSYDAVLMSQVLEHAVDPRAWIAKAARLLRPGGILCVAVPNFGSFLRHALQGRDPYIAPPMHLNYFSRNNLTSLLASEELTTFLAETVSRVRPDALSRRAPKRLRATWLLESAVRQGQKLPLAVIDRVGLGMFLNIYAMRDPSITRGSRLKVEGVHGTTAAAH